MTDAYTEGASAPLTPPPAPSTVSWSYRLYVVGAALGAIAAVLTLVFLSASVDAAVAGAQRSLQGQDTSNVDVQSLARTVAYVFGVIQILVLVVVAVLTFVFAGKLRLGRNWARIVLLVIAVLQLFGLGEPYGVGVLKLLVFAAAAVLSFLPASSAWFRHFRAQRTPTV